MTVLLYMIGMVIFFTGVVVYGKNNDWFYRNDPDGEETCFMLFGSLFWLVLLPFIITYFLARGLINIIMYFCNMDYRNVNIPKIVIKKEPKIPEIQDIIK